MGHGVEDEATKGRRKRTILMRSLKEPHQDKDVGGGHGRVEPKMRVLLLS